MAGDVTVGALTRLSYMPNTANRDGGQLIAGQDYFNIYFTGGSISNVTLTNCTITLDAINNTPIGATTPSTGKFTTLQSTGAATLASAGITGNATVGGTLGVTGNSTFSGTLGVTGALTAASFSGAGTGLTGTAASLSIGGNAATATTATSATTAGSATTAATVTSATQASITTCANLTTVGTIGTGTWQGTLVAGQYGGTGVNNSGKTITLGGNLTTSGAFALTLTQTAATNVTLPTSGTLATVGGNIGAATATTPAAGNNSTSISTTAFTQNAINIFSLGFVNKFRNGTFDIWQHGTSGTITAGSQAYTADGWIVNCTGANVGWAQSSTGMTIEKNALAITGATGVTDTYCFQRIESAIASSLYNQQVTVQFAIYNGTGSAIIPTIAVSYANSTDNFSSTTSILSATNLQSCANGAVTTVAYTFPAGTNVRNGIQVSIDFGSVLNSGASSVNISAADIRVTPGISTGLNNNPPPPELRPSAIEFLFCRWYVFSTFPSGVTPGYNKGTTGALSFAVVSGYEGCINIPVNMRSAPTVTSYSPNAASGVSTVSGQTLDTNLSSNSCISLQYGSVAGTASAHIFATSEL